MPIEVESPEQLGYDTITNNLSESSVADRRLRDLGLELDLDELLLCYGDHLGDPLLREAVAAGGDGLSPEDVLVTAGAAAALFCVATTLLEAGDHAVVVRTNYATNLETPRAIGCDISYLDLSFDEGWNVSLSRLESLVRPTTRLISLTCPHNPTGAVLDEATLRGAIALAERHGCRLLIDETYREMTFGTPLPCAAACSPTALSVSSLSKTYGLPGLRSGWLICRDPALRETLLAAKEQIFICTSVVDEEIAYQALQRRDRWLPQIKEHIATALNLTRDFLAGQSDFEWIEPRGGVVGLFRLRDAVLSHTDVDRFYEVLFEKHQTMVGPGHWFELPLHYMRVGYGWPTLEALQNGLESLTAAAAAARR